MTPRTASIAVFWIVLVAFLAWDWSRSEPVNPRKEPPLFALGSGQPPSGGHCSAF